MERRNETQKRGRQILTRITDRQTDGRADREKEEKKEDSEKITHERK